jgi:hypothetical protein
VLLAAIAVVVASMGVAFAGTITAPDSSPFPVPGDVQGNPQSFTISVTNFGDADLLAVEQCNGVDPTKSSWTPIADCDAQTATSFATADTNGNATFPRNDPTLGFHPFKGASPSGLFNCLSPTQPSPNNGLVDYRDCMIRVSTNLNAATPDQALLAIQLPDPGGSPTTVASTTVAPTTVAPTTVAPTTTTTSTTTTLPHTTPTTARPSSVTTVVPAGTSPSTTHAAPASTVDPPADPPVATVASGTTTLPRTGAPTAQLVFSALLLIASGLALWGAVRPRRHPLSR